MDFNFSEMSIEELEKLNDAVYKALSDKRKYQRLKDWEELTDKIKDYVKKYENITLYWCGEEFIIDNDMDYQTPGEIGQCF